VKTRLKAGFFLPSKVFMVTTIYRLHLRCK